MNGSTKLEGRPVNHFEKRTDRKERCDGCDSDATRETYRGFSCAACEAYHAHYDALMQGYAVVLKAWQERHGITLEQALQTAREFDDLYEAAQVFLMEGYTFEEYTAQRKLEEAGTQAPEAASGVTV